MSEILKLTPVFVHKTLALAALERCHTCNPVIGRSEIEAKAAEFAIHTSDVQRDYVFGWLLFGIYSASPLAKTLALKGGNCFRKAYFPNTRFSRDLDFATENGGK